MSPSARRRRSSRRPAILSRYCDVYKAEFPGTFGHETDAQLRTT